MVARCPTRPGSWLCSAWTYAAFRAALAASSEDGAPKKLPREFVDVAKQLHAKHDVDTLMAEQAYDALVEIAERLAVVSEKRLTEWLDEWRDF